MGLFYFPLWYFTSPVCLWKSDKIPFSKIVFFTLKQDKNICFFTKLWDNCGKNQKKCNLQFDFLWMTVKLSANKQVWRSNLVIKKMEKKKWKNFSLSLLLPLWFSLSLLADLPVLPHPAPAPITCTTKLSSVSPLKVWFTTMVLLSIRNKLYYFFGKADSQSGSAFLLSWPKKKEQLHFRNCPRLDSVKKFSSSVLTQIPEI